MTGRADGTFFIGYGMMAANCRHHPYALCYALPFTIVASRVRLCRGTPTHPRSPLATLGGSRYSLRLVAKRRARRPIEAFWWSLLRLPSLNLFGGGVLPCRGRLAVLLAFFRLSMQFASYVRVALVGLLRPVCCRARHSPPPTSGRAVGADAPFFIGCRLEFALALIRRFPSLAASRGLPPAQGNRMIAT